MLIKPIIENHSFPKFWQRLKLKGKLIYWFRVSEKRGWPQVIFDVHTYVGILTCSEIYQGRPLHIEISLLLSYSSQDNNKYEK